MKKIILFIFLLFLTSCEVSVSLPSTILDALETKYNVKCETENDYSSDEDIVYMTFNCENIDGEIFVEYNKKTDKIKDNYLALKYKNDLEKYYEDILNSVFNSAQVYLKIGAFTLPNKIKVDSTFEDLQKYLYLYQTEMFFMVNSKDYNEKNLESLVKELYLVNNNMDATLFVLEFDIGKTFTFDEIYEINNQEKYMEVIRINKNSYTITKKVDTK